MLEWADVFHEMLRGIWQLIQIKWLFLSDIALEFWDRYLFLDQRLKPVVIVSLLLCLAIAKLAWSAWITDISDLVKDGEADGKAAAPTGYPSPPTFLSPPKKWLAHYIACFYIERCRPNRIGWYAPRLLTWLAFVGLAGCTITSVLDALGVEMFQKPSILLAFASLLAFGLLVGYAHNEGRLQAKGNKVTHVKFSEFAIIFAKPLTLTFSIVALVLYRPSLSTVWSALRSMGVF